MLRLYGAIVSKYQTVGSKWDAEVWCAAGEWAALQPAWESGSCVTHSTSPMGSAGRNKQSDGPSLAPSPLRLHNPNSAAQQRLPRQQKSKRDSCALEGRGGVEQNSGQSCGRSKQAADSDLGLTGWELCDLGQETPLLRASASSPATQSCKYSPTYNI